MLSGKLGARKMDVKMGEQRKKRKIQPEVSEMEI